MSNFQADDPDNGWEWAARPGDPLSDGMLVGRHRACGGGAEATLPPGLLGRMDGDPGPGLRDWMLAAKQQIVFGHRCPTSVIWIRQLLPDKI